MRKLELHVLHIVDVATMRFRKLHPERALRPVGLAELRQQFIKPPVRPGKMKNARRLQEHHLSEIHSRSFTDVCDGEVALLSARRVYGHVFKFL